MLELPEVVTLYDVAAQHVVDAELIRLNRKRAAIDIDGVWWEEIASQTVKKSELDRHWQWRKIVGEVGNKVRWDCLAVQGPENAIEGAIAYRIDAKSQIDEGEGAVYVDRLAVAPRNRPWLVNPRKYGRVGTVLLFAAVRQSYSLGLGGRVWLECLPDERSREFYANKGFMVLREDDEGMIGYELPAAKAEKWLIAEGCLDG